MGGYISKAILSLHVLMCVVYLIARGFHESHCDNRLVQISRILLSHNASANALCEKKLASDLSSMCDTPASLTGENSGLFQYKLLTSNGKKHSGGSSRIIISPQQGTPGLSGTSGDSWIPQKRVIDTTESTFSQSGQAALQSKQIQSRLHNFSWECVRSTYCR